MKTKLKPFLKWLFIPMVFCLAITASLGQTVYHGNSAHSNLYSILTPKPGPKPRINGPVVYACGPGNPFLYRIPCQGDRPIVFSVKGLPSGLELDSSTGIISGMSPVKGEYNIVLEASNKSGKDKRKLKIVAGDKLALTPYMGWNSWNVYHDGVTQKGVSENADAMVRSGMADAGYQYINIDDCWTNTAKGNPWNKDSLRIGPSRDDNGNIIPNVFFPDMGGMVEHIHSKGLKAGIYSSPGPNTCMRYTGSYRHEEQDVRQYAEWGFDFLKYDWCYYGLLPGIDSTVADYQKPYKQISDLIKSQDRDIVLNLCQYGWGDSWEWAASVGGQSWRTDGDLIYLDKLFLLYKSNLLKSIGLQLILVSI